MKEFLLIILVNTIKVSILWIVLLNQLTQYISSILHEWGIGSKVIAFSADNTNCNFGGVARNGKNNVFYKLKEIFNKDLIRVGCAAHILNNAVQTAADTLPIDVPTGYYWKHFSTFLYLHSSSPCP